MPHWLDTREYPFAPHYLEFGPHRMHYVDEGQGKVLLFVHGTPSWSFDFRHLIKAFSPTHRCIAPDHLGFGLSDKPATYPYRTQPHADNLMVLIEQLNLKNITLVVHDFGGPIGLNYALQQPDNVKKLVILNTWLWSSEGEPEFEQAKKILRSPLLPFLYKYLNFSARFLLPRSFGERNKFSRHIHRHYTRPLDKPSGRMGTLAFARSLLKDQAWFESLWMKRACITDKPTLFVWGMKDTFITGKYLDKFSDHFFYCRVVRLEETGHFPQEENPEAVIREMQAFLTQGSD
jgi:pimeloyl-ACP methyl ester carboxylesterase